MECNHCKNKHLQQISFEENYMVRDSYTGKFIRHAKNGWIRYACGCGWESEPKMTKFDVVFEENKRLVR